MCEVKGGKILSESGAEADFMQTSTFSVSSLDQLFLSEKEEEIPSSLRTFSVSRTDPPADPHVGGWLRSSRPLECAEGKQQEVGAERPSALLLVDRRRLTVGYL